MLERRNAIGGINAMNTIKGLSTDSMIGTSEKLMK
jgi:hypothetical protein